MMARRSARHRIAAVCAALTAMTGLLDAHEARAEEADDRQGPIMLNGKIGPAIGVADFSGFTAFALELEAGYALIPNRGYVTVAPSFAFGEFTLFTLAAGFQYEVPLPVEKLYGYGRATIGFGVLTQGGDPAFHIGPHVGAKYQITEMLHVGAEPLSMPI